MLRDGYNRNRSVPGLWLKAYKEEGGEKEMGRFDVLLGLLIATLVSHVCIGMYLYTLQIKLDEISSRNEFLIETKSFLLQCAKDLVLGQRIELDESWNITEGGPNWTGLAYLEYTNGTHYARIYGWQTEPSKPLNESIVWIEPLLVEGPLPELPV